MAELFSLTLVAQTTAPTTTGLAEAFGRSGAMAQLVLGLLLCFSIGSWTIFLWKIVHLRRADRQSRKFLEIFRASKRFSEVSAATAK